MSKQFKVAVNTGKDSENTLLDVPPKAGANGQPLRIKATPGAKYQLQEVSDTGKSSGKPVGPDFVKTRRVGKNLQILLEGSTEADVIIEDYYDVFVDGYNGLVGQAENGSFYEYIPEDPDTAGLVGSLRDGGQAVNAALGGAEVQGAGAAIGLLAFNPLLGALGLLGAGAAAVAAANTTDTGTGTGTGTGTTPTGTTTGALTATAPNDSGVIGDNLTNDRTPTLSGTVPTGSSASVTINGQTTPVTVNPDGTWTFTQPTNLPDGTYYPVLSVTTNGVTTQTNITPFTIDNTPPTVAVTSSAAALAANETANITFTLSEPSTDFALDDIAVTGGQLSNLVQSATDPKIYTARFTPTAGSTPGTATISVASDKFADAAANRNTDGAEPNNTVTIRTNATVTGALTPTAPNDSGTVGDNLTNDTTPALSGKVPAGATATVTLNGQTYPATVNPDGTWTAQVPETGKLPDGTYTPQLNVTSGGVTTTTPITPFTIDTVPAKVAVTSNTNTLGSGQTANVTFTLTEPVNDFTADDVVVTGGTLGPLTKSPTDPKVYTATFTPSNTGTTASISVPSDKFADAAGNRNTDGAEPDNTITLTTNAPISGQLAPVSDNTVGIPNDQKTNDPTPNLIGKVPAGSSATITLNGQTSPVTVATDGTWTFTQPTNLPDGTYTPQLNVTTGSVTTSQNITPFTVDTLAPTVAITSSVNTSTTPLSAGQSTVLSFTVSEATTNLTDADLAVVGGTLGPLQQSATNPLLYTATFTATPGTTASTTASVSLASDKFSDAAGNLNKDGADANNTWSTSVTPTTNPTPNPNGVKTALSINPIATDNVLLANEGTATTYPVTGKVTGAFAAGDVVNIALNGKNYPTAVAADGSFSVTVSMADLKADPDTKVEGSITGTGGDTATAAQDYTVETGNTATQTALSIDPVTADNLLNATESTNPVAITGKVTGRFAAGDTVTLTVNGKTFTGAAAANGNFSINVPGADLKADSDTTVDGRVTGTGGSTANAIQNYALSDSSSTVSPSLKTALSIDPILGDNVISATEGNANSYTVTGKVTGTFAPGDIVEVKLNDKTYAAAVAADGSYSVAVPMSALKADPDTKIEASITGTGGDPATAAQDYTVETSNAPTQTSLTINPVTADNILGSTESTGNIPITGKVNGKFSTGDTVTLSVNGKTFTGTAAADGSYSIAVPAADLLADPDTQVDGTVTGAGGTLARALQDYGVDANVNPVNPSVKTALSINPILGDNVISTAEGNANNYTVTGKVTGAFKEGDAVELQLNNKTYATTVAADGSYSVPVPMADLKADADTKIEARITGTGGDTATAAQDYTVEGNTNSGRTALSIDPVTADNVINNTESTTTATTVTGKVSGTFAAGDTVTLTVNGKPFTGSAAANGNFSISVPTADLVADKDTTVEGTVTGTGGTTANAIQDYGLNTDGGTNPVDTTPPTIAITSNQASLATGQQATITFTLSEASTDFVWNGTTGDINVTGGTLGPITQSSSNPLVYTAVFTPANNSTTNGVISVASDRFSDAAGNFNKDGADANNTVTLSVNTTTTAPSLVLTNDTAEVGEAGGVTNQTAGTALTSTTSGVTITNVLSNDTGNTPTVRSIQLPSATTPTTVAAGTTSTTGTPLEGNFGTLRMGADGTYSYTVNNANATVQGLRTSANTLSDVFTYTANDGTGPKTANLVVTIKGTNDAPTVVVQEADKTGTVGTALTAFNVANNFADVDTAANGETATLSATLANGSALPSWLSFNAATGAFSGTPTAAGTTSVRVTRTDAAGASVSDTFDIVVTTVTDTTPPTIAITSNQASLATGQQATITFTLSEASTDFVWNGTTGDINVTGGTLGAITQSTSNPLVYTAVFTPATNSTANGVISVASDRFSDAAGNFNKDGADANNTVTLSVNTTNTAPALSLTNDAKTVAEEGLNVPAATATGNVLSNDTGNTPKVSGIQPASATNATPVGSTGNTTIAGQFGSLAIAENGTYTYTVNNANDNVQALRTGSQSLSDVFTYTADDGTGPKTANLVITITGTNDAPTLTTALPDRTGTAGTALTPFSIANNITDVDSTTNGETATLTAKLANGADLPSWLTFNPATGTFSGTPTAAGTTSATVTRTDAAGANVSDTFDIVVAAVTDTTPPTIAITSNQASLATGQQATITFTLSEPSTDFVWNGTTGDISVSGGTLGALMQDPLNSRIYTAVFTPAANSTTNGVIKVESDKFSDAAGNFNKDGAEANNTVTLTVNTTTAAPALSLTNDARSVAEEGLNVAAATASGNVLSNDSGNSPKVTGIQPLNGTTTTGVGSTGNTTLTGQFGSLAIAENGTYTYTVNNANANVQALRTGNQSLSDVFTYTANDGTGPKTANLVITITGTNDAPILTSAVADRTGTVGTALATFSVASNFDDVDSAANGETVTLSATLANGSALPSWLSFNAATGSFSGTPTAAGTTSVRVTRTDAAGANVSDTFDITVTTTGTASGKLAPSSDSGVTGDNLTNDKTPALEGTAPIGSTAVVNVGGKDYTVIVKPDGTWTLPATDELPDGTYTPVLKVTPAGGGTPVNTNLTPFTIDTVPPTVKVEAASKVLAANTPTTITFTLSEEASDFTRDDVIVSGGEIGPLTKTSENPLVYTATFTPAATGTSATISVDSDRFSDAAANLNKDSFRLPGAENTNNQVTLATNSTSTGALAPASDSGTKGDNKTNDDTPALTGTAPTGSSAVVNVNGKDYPVTVKADGTWDLPATDKLPDGTYTPVLKVTPAGGGTPVSTNLTPFTIDTVAPTIKVETSTKVLTANATTTVTFTLSEEASDFTKDDVVVTGGAISDPVRSSNPLVYTATFTPATTGTSATIGVDSDRFSDAAANLNKDSFRLTGAENTNNQVTLATNASSSGQLAPTSDTGVPGDNLTNDKTPALEGKAPTGSSAVVTINNVDYPVTVKPDGTWSLPATNELPDGTYTPVLKVTPEGGGTPVSTDLTPFTIDTVPPTVKVEAASTTLLPNRGTTVTFTLSEASSDFTKDDVVVTGGSITDPVKSSNPLVYTATFTPAATGNTASITIDNERFADAAGNRNQDSFRLPGAENTNNQVNFSTNFASTGQLAPDSDTGAKGDNLTKDDTPALTGKVPPGSSATVTVNGKPYPATVNPDGTWTAQIPDTDKLPDGTYTPVLSVTPAGGGTPVETNLTPFTIDTKPPTVSITADSTVLTTGKTALITFTLSEEAADFVKDDIVVTGGDIGTLTKSSTDPKVYTATFTPTTTATSATIRIDSNKFSDAATNVNIDTGTNPAPAGATFETNNLVTLATNAAPVDTTAPTVIVTRNGTGTLTSSETITFTLSEPSKDFTQADLSTNTGSFSNFTPVPTSGTAATGYTQYTATFTPVAGSSGQATIGVRAGRFSDAAGNQNKDTFQIGASGEVLEDNNKVDISFNTITPAPDTTPPTVIVSRAGTGSLTQGGSDTITFTLSENSLTFVQDDITVTGGTLTNWTQVASSGSPTTGYHLYTATFTPTPNSNGTATVGVKASTFKDLAGNNNQDTFEPNLASTTFEPNNQVSIGFNTTTADTTPPAVAVVRSNTGTITGPETILFNFSEAIAPTSFGTDDITVSGGTISNLVAVQGSGNKQFSATFTPTPGATGTATIGVLAGKFTDTSNNANVDTFEAASANYEANNHVSAAFDTSAPAPVDKTTPTVSITRIGSGTIGTGPGVAGATETIVFTFSEAINPASFSVDDVTVTSGTLSGLAPVSGSNNTQYTATYTPSSTLQDPATVGTAIISIASDKFTDVAGNANKDTHLPGIAGTVQESNNQISIGFNTDTTAPTIAISRATSGTVTGTETITFTLSEASINFSKSDIDVNGTGTLGDLVADTTSGNANTGYTRYTAVFTPVANSAGDTQIGVKNNTFSDLVGNQNRDTYVSGVTGATQEGNNQVNLSFNTHPIDRTPPTVTVARSGSGTLTGATANETVTFTLSEASTTFGQSDITVTGGTLSNFAAVTTSGTAGTGYTRYTATFTPTGTTGTGTVGVKSGQFTDNAGNANLDTFEANQPGTVQEANNQVSIAFNKSGADTTPPTIVVERIGTGTLTTGQTETLLFTTSEVANLEESRITVIKGGTLSNLAPVASSGSVANGFTQWTATFTPTPGSSGQAQIGVLNGKVDDPSGNFNLDTYQAGVPGTVFEANNLVSFNYDTTIPDTTPPTIALSRSGSGTVKTNETIYFTLSEPSKNFALADIDVEGGSLSGFSAVPSSGNNTDGHTQYTAIFSAGSGKGVAVIGVKSGKFSDAAANQNTDTSDPSSPNYQANNQVFLDYDTNSTDTTAPTVAVIRSTSKVLGFGETELITFVLSEPSLDFAQDDLTITGGGISEFTRVNSSGTTTNGFTQYTALFTPTFIDLEEGAASNPANIGVASIGVVHGKFKDAANNLNQDTFQTPEAGSTQVQEGNNQVKIVFDTNPAAKPTAQPDTATATEAGSSANQATSGISPTGNVLTNDTVVTGTKMVQSISTASNAQSVAAGTTSSSSNATQIAGEFGTLTIGADGSYSYAVNNSNPTVQALLPSSTALTDTFTYTVNDGTSASASTTLKVSVRGANDRPEVDKGLLDTAATATIGTAFSYTFGQDAFRDPDSGDTLTYSATLSGGASLPSWLSFNPTTRTFSGTPPSGTAAQQITLVVTATDTAQNTVTDNFVVNIGNNNAPTLEDITAPAAIAEALNAKEQNIAAITGTLSVNDTDSGNVVSATSTQASIVWSGGALPSSADVSELIRSDALNFGASVTPNGTAQSIGWTYDPSAANLDWLAKDQTLTITYPVTVSDGQGGSAVKNLVIRITGTNDAPVAADITKEYNKGNGSDTFSLVGSATDLDQGETATLTVDSATAISYTVTNAAGVTNTSTTLPAGVTLLNGQLTIDPKNDAFKDLTAGQTIVIVANYKIKDAQNATTDQKATLTVKGSGSGDPIAQNDTGSISERGGTNNNTTNDATVLNESLLSNDTASGGATIRVDTVKAVTAAGADTSVPTSGNVKVTGKFGTLTVQPGGGNSYELNNSNAEVEALQTGEKLTDVFSYTIKDSITGKTSTATLTMTINGANDAPVAVADTLTVGEAGGTANGTPSTAPNTGNLLSNDTDVDKNDTRSVSAIRAGSGTNQDVTSTETKQIDGSHGTLSLKADGSYTYAVDNSKAAVQQLKNAQDSITDTFTYTVKDAAGLTSTNTLTVTITGANDAPVVTVTSNAPTTATNLTAFNLGTAFSLADVDVASTGLMRLTLSSSATDGRFSVNLGSTGATLTSGGDGTTNSAVISGTLAQLQALTATASSFSFVDTASQAAARPITITALLNDRGNDGTDTNALTDSKSIKVTLAADPNKDAIIDITAITDDTGRFNNDYITNDNKLTFRGTVDKFNASTARVKLELVDASNATVASETVTVTPTQPTGTGTWSWTDPTTAGRGDGTYKLVATIVDLAGNRISPNSTVGSNTGTRDEQNIVIDTNTPNTANKDATIDIITIDDGLSSTTAANGSKDTGNANDFITSDRTLTYRGTVSGWTSNGSDLVKLELKNSSGQVVGMQYVNPVLRSGTTTADWTWDHTATTLDADASYTLEATIVDLAGNRVNDKAPVNGTNGGTDSQLIVIDATAPTQTVSFSSMTKDSGVTTGNANWITSDGSAGRLVSGTIDQVLNAGESVNVYANGTLVGKATVAAGGKTWAITDTNGYSADWTYTAKVEDVAGNSKATLATSETQKVTTDFSEAAPVITGLFDAGNASVANNGSSTQIFTKISGTASANAIVYVYNNSLTNLIGTTTANGSGAWTLSDLEESVSSSTFAAKQLDAHGNLSPVSNLWKATTTGSAIDNGDFTDGATGYVTDITPIQLGGGRETNEYIRGGNRIGVIDLVPNQGGMTIGALPGNWTNPVVGALTPSGTQTWSGGTWSENVFATTAGDRVEQTAWGTFFSLAKGKILAGSADSIVNGENGTPSSATNTAVAWGTKVSVVEGKTFAFSFTYWNTTAKDTNTPGFLDVMIDGKLAMTTKNFSAGVVTVHYVATQTGEIDISLNTWSNTLSADFTLDNITFNEVATGTPDNTLVAGGKPPATPQPDVLDYTGGALDALESNDTITVKVGDLQALLETDSNYIIGGAGADTLILQAGTKLNLDVLTRNQTVQALQQIEIFELKGNSTLTLTANDVLSLGGANATTMSGFNFRTTTDGTGSTSSDGKVQFVVHALSTDVVNLDKLTNDGIETNGLLGNTGLDGVWTNMGTTSIGAVTYKVYNHSTTQAQVLVSNATVNTPDTTQSIVIERADTNNAVVGFSEEFTAGTGTTPNKEFGSTINTQAWKISVVDVGSANAPVSELKLNSGAQGLAWIDGNGSDGKIGLGTDGMLQLGLDTPNVSTTEHRLNTFESKAGEFTSISFKFTELNFNFANNTNGGALVKFYDVNGDLVGSTKLTPTTTTFVENFNFSLPTGVKAQSFSIFTNSNDKWYIDELQMTPAATTLLVNNSSTLDATPLLSGSYSSNLKAGEVIRVFEGSTLIGTATVDTSTKTWTLQLETPQSIGNHTYTAKIESSTNSTVATSNNYSLNVLASSLNINAISTDSGTPGDFVTNDNTLVYSGQLPSPLAAGEKVRVQIFAKDGVTQIREGVVTPAAGSTAWTWDNTGATALADGDYVIKATIVGSDNVTPVASYGTRGTDTQPMTIDATAPTQTVAFSSMTKDSGVTTGNANWTTSDASAGRLVSGTISAALNTNETVKVFANGVEIGDAVVNGTAWAITDTNGYNANWTYTARVVDVANNGQVATQVVTTDFVESAPTITGVFDTVNTSTLANNGSTTNTLSSVKGTASGGAAAAGSTIYLYNNSYNTLVGTAEVDSSGNWSVTSLSNTFAGSNTFAAVQVDTHGNQSLLSNTITVNLPTTNLIDNGNFSNGVAGFTTELTETPGGVFGSSDTFRIVSVATANSAQTVTETKPTNQSTTAVSYGGGVGTWSKVFLAGSTDQGTIGNPNGAMTGNVMQGQISTGTKIIWADTTDVLAGLTYTFNLDYSNNDFSGTGAKPLSVTIDGNTIDFVTNVFEAGRLTATYKATTTKSIAISIQGTKPNSSGGDFLLDNISFGQVPTTAAANTFATIGPTDNPDTLVYAGGALDALDSDDNISVTGTNLQTMLAARGAINGGAGVDTLKLAANTSLNLISLTANQTVKPIQQVEVFQLQGGSTLTLSANDVLSLGGSNASTMSNFSFASTMGGTASTGSTGKVQFVVNALSNDTVNLTGLTLDGITTNGIQGNTGLAGEWANMGNTTIGGVTYKVYNHSTSQAQLLVANATVNTANRAPIVTDTDSLLPNPLGVSIAAGTKLNTTFADTATVDVTRTSATGTLSFNNGAVVSNPDGQTRIQLAANVAGFDEKISYAFTTPAEGVRINFEDFTGGDTMQVKVNGQLMTLTTEMQGGTQSVAMPDAAGTTLVGTLRQGGDLGVNQFTLSIRSSDVPGGVINSIEILGKSNSTGGGFWMYAPSSIGDAFTIRSVAQLFGNVYFDQDNHEMKGVAITFAGTSTDLSSKGTYSYSTNGGVSWTALAAGLSDTNATFLKPTDLVRFVPVSGTPPTKHDLTARVVDTSGETGSANLTSGNTVNVSTNGGSTAFSVKTISLNAATTAPVLLDLNNDGQISYSQIQRDMNGDSVLDNTAWAGAQDGLLVRDTFGDGTVRSNNQFAFARHSGETDLQGLAAQFDSNHDGVFDRHDAKFGEFAVWQDADQDGLADAGEVKSLAELGIVSINLTSDGVVRTPAEGVTEAGQATAQLADGTTVLVADASFAYTPGTAEAKAATEVADAVQTPEHCDQACHDTPEADTGTSLFKLDTTEWQNKPYSLSAEQLAELNLNVPADDAMTSMLKAADVLLDTLDPKALQHALHESMTNDGALNLNKLLTTDFVQDSLTTLQTLGHTPDTTLQMLLDTHMQTAAV